HVACGVAAKPQNSIRNFLRTANASHRDALLHLLKGFTLTGSDHLVRHRRLDEAGTDRRGANAPCGVFQRRALGEPKHSLLGGVIDSTLRTAHESSWRRAIDDGSTSLLAHLAQLKLHAAPDTTQIDADDPVEILARLIRGFSELILHAGIVIGGVQATKNGDSLIHHRFDLSVISYVATDGERFVTLVSELL